MRNGLDLWFSVWAVRCLEFQIGRQGRSPVQLTSSWSEDLETRRIFLRASDEWIYKWKTIRHLRWKQCDQIWQFLQIRATKIPKYLATFWAIVKNGKNKVKLLWVHSGHLSLRKLGYLVFQNLVTLESPWRSDLNAYRGDVSFVYIWQ